VVKAGLVQLDDLLSAMDRSAANLAKLELVWERAASFIPTGPARGSHPEYDDLSRTWKDLLGGLPPIDGWTVTEELPDIDSLGQAYIDCFEIGEPPFQLDEAGDKPGRDLAEYRFRLNRARRRAARKRLQELTALIELALPPLLDGVSRDSRDRIEGPGVDRITASLSEIERLMGDTSQRQGRWGDLYRHLHFGQGHDWHDIQELDWPSVRSDVEAAAFADTDPLPVPDIDLGEAAAGHLTGVATVALSWNRLDDDGFERLVYDLLRGFPEHQNVQWLTRTRAADRARDLSLERILRDSTGGIRTERVIVQAKHWLKRSVGPSELAGAVTGVELWGPPLVHALIIATSGRFTTDAVDWAERHNNKGQAPYIDLWPDSKLETLLAQKPYLAATHGLR
jgi:Restriction endonuclease